jgi:anti-sigma factor RsiW
MPDLRTPHQRHEETSLLLPWYVNGTLEPDERELVETHLRECAECAGEREDLRQMKAMVVQAIENEPVPSLPPLPRIRARIEEEKGARLSWWARFDHRLASLLQRRPVPVLIAALLVVQFAVLAGLAGVLYFDQRRAGVEPMSRPGVLERGIPAPRIQISFQPTASEQGIRELLHQVHGRIVDGPSAKGVYRVEVILSSGDPAELEGLLKTLRARTDLVRFAERVEP